MSRPFPKNMAEAHIYQEVSLWPETSLRKAAEKSKPARARLVPGQILVHQDDVLAPIPVHVGDPETRRVVHERGLAGGVELLELAGRRLKEDADTMRALVGPHHVVEAVSVQVSGGNRGRGRVELPPLLCAGA